MRGGAHQHRFWMHSSTLSMFIHLRSVHEDQPGEKWKQLFDKLWPFYRRWYLREGHAARPGYLTCIEKLEEYMPELLPVYEKLSKLAGGGDVESRFLSMWNPPAFMSGCSQVAWTRDRKALIRNYDYSPLLFDGILLRTNWLKPVIGMLDSSWGVLDGINGDGLSVSLTFGGRNVMGEGFGIPLVLRYVLETCADTHSAIQTLCSIPVHMAYNVTLLDKTGYYVTVYLSPDRPPVVTDSPVGTNHQIEVEWEDYARISATEERLKYLQENLRRGRYSTEEMITRFLMPPLYNTQYEKSFGTLYTAAYYPDSLEMELLWPAKRLTYGFNEFSEELTVINISKSVSSFLVE
jgi:predicted choloylglycine hydrolase